MAAIRCLNWRKGGIGANSNFFGSATCISCFFTNFLYYFSVGPPTVCGTNMAGQHMYVDITTSCNKVQQFCIFRFIYLFLRKTLSLLLGLPGVLMQKECVYSRTLS